MRERERESESLLFNATGCNLESVDCKTGKYSGSIRSKHNSQLMTVVKDPELARVIYTSMIFIPFSWNSLDLWMGSISNRLLPVVRKPRFQKVYTMGCLVSFRQANRVYIRVTPSCESFVNARSPLSRFILRREKDIFASPTPSSEFKAVSSVVRDKWSTRVVYSWWRYTRKVDVGKCIDRKIWKRVNYGIRR